MHKINWLTSLTIVFFGATLMSAQATRTWVSGVGDDANPCSRTAPCKTFAGAISKTAPGGEIDALDPGGFGALTITKSITIDGGGGQVASVLVAGTNGIVVAAQPTDIVVIRNLRFDGLLGGGNANAGLSGIRFISGKDLNIENCFILGFNNTGIDIELGASGTAHIVNTIIKNTGSCNPASCLTAQGDGIFASTTSGTVVVSVDDSQIMVSSNNGVEASNNARVDLNRTFIASSGASGAISDGAGSSSRLGIDYGAVLNGNNGVSATNGSTLVVGHTTIAYNGNNGYNPSGGSVFAWSTGVANASNGTNRVHDNGNTGTPTGYVTEN
jgi:hypothetical protein